MCRHLEAESGVQQPCDKCEKDCERAETESECSSPPVWVSTRVFSLSLWVRAGGFLLGICAGAVNAIAFLAIGAFVSHQTGSFSRIGLGDEDVAVTALLLVVSFVLGSTVCGLLVSGGRPRLGALYDICLIIEAGLLIATTLLADQGVARYLASAACGLQNGMATHWGGAVVRTTHVTGLFTDVGLLLGRLLSMLARKRCGKQFSARDSDIAADDLSKLSVLATIAVAYLVGVAMGAAWHRALGHYAFLIPAVLVGSAGLLYCAYRMVVLGHSFVSDNAMRRTQEFEEPEKAEPQKADNTPVQAFDGQAWADEKPSHAMAPSYCSVVPGQVAPRQA